MGTIKPTMNSSNSIAEMTTEMRVQLIQVPLVQLLHVDWYMSVVSLRVTPRSMLTFPICVEVALLKVLADEKIQLECARKPPIEKAGGYSVGAADVNALRVSVGVGIGKTVG